MSFKKILALAVMATVFFSIAPSAHAESYFSISYGEKRGGHNAYRNDWHRGPHHGWDRGRSHRWERPHYYPVYYSPPYRSRTVIIASPPVIERQVVYQQPVINTSASDDGYCREYQTRVKIGNTYKQAYGTACLQPDGTWQRVD
jgi:hypothetical protein